MTRADLEAIKAREKEATPGPWWYTDVWGGCEARDEADDDTICETPYRLQGRHEKDAEFIAHAREDIPGLVAEVERLRGYLRSAVETLEGSGVYQPPPVYAIDALRKVLNDE